MCLISRCIEIQQKYGRKPENESCQQRSGVGNARLFKLCGFIPTFSRPFLATFTFGFSGAFLLTFDASINLSQNAAHWPTSPTSASPMLATYRMISVRKPQMKSAGTLQTCPDLPLTISDSFHFRLFGHIAAQSRCMWYPLDN